MIVLDVEQESRINPDASLPTRWNGLWEGPQPTQLITAQINGVQRGFAFSFDADGVNRLYELQNSSSYQTGVDDYSQVLGTVPIKSYFITKRFDFTPNAEASKFIRKQLVGAEMWVSNLNEKVTFEMSYLPDSYPKFTQLGNTISIASSQYTPIQSGCIPQISLPKYSQIKFPSPDINDCQSSNQINLQEGAEFQIKVDITGTCIVDRVRIGGNLNATLDLPEGICVGDEIDPIVSCPINDLDYYRIIPLPSSISSVQG